MQNNLNDNKIESKNNLQCIFKMAWNLFSVIKVRLIDQWFKCRQYKTFKKSYVIVSQAVALCPSTDTCKVSKTDDLDDLYIDTSEYIT